MLGVQPNTVIRGNHVHDSAQACGVYLDQGSGLIEVNDNLVYQVSKNVCLNNYYLGRNETCFVHDNVFEQNSQADAGSIQIAADAGIQLEYKDILSQ